MSDSPSILLPMCVFGGFALFVVMGLAMSVRIVPEYQRLSVFRLGRYIGQKGPGLVFLIPFVDQATLDAPVQVQTAQEELDFSSVMGETITPVHLEGSVRVSGKTWNAVSKTLVPAGQRVRVTRVLLEIEAL